MLLSFSFELLDIFVKREALTKITEHFDKPECLPNIPYRLDLREKLKFKNIKILICDQQTSE